MHTKYINPAIRQLRDQQVRFAPREKKIEQANSAEELLGELDPTRVYPYGYICFRVTKYRPDSYPDLKLSGHEASHDLRLFVEDVSDAANIPGARAESTSWTDVDGDLWLFGGWGYDGADGYGLLNDLWKIELIAEVVDFDEFALLAAHWMKTGCTEGTDCARADWHVDGSINLLDLQELAARWLKEE